MVNIFVIVPDIYKTAELLDNKRLGKQRVEAKQIIDILENYDNTRTFAKGWSNHPATKSWIGFTNHLKVYYNIICREWIKRGFTQNMSLYSIDESLFNIIPTTFDGISINFDKTLINQYSFPVWFSFYPFYMSHQAALCRKDPLHYKFLLRDEIKPFLELGYLWPCNIPNNAYFNWNSSYFDELGSGVPPIYRITPKDILQWIKNPLINHKTGRQISEKSAIYLDNIEAMKGHNIIIYNGIIYYNNYPLCYIENINMIINNIINPTITEIVYRKAIL